MTASHSVYFSGSSTYADIDVFSTASSSGHPQNLIQGMGVSGFLYDKCSNTGWRRYAYGQSSQSWTTSISHYDIGGHYGTCAGVGGHEYQNKSNHSYYDPTSGLNYSKWLCSGSGC